MLKNSYRNSCKVLLIESCDFISFPTGGQLSSAKQLLSAYQDRFALVGICTDKTPVGKWVLKSIDGVNYWFFGIGRRFVSAQKPFIPERIKSALQLAFYKKKILNFGCEIVFTQSPELLIVCSFWALRNICYQFPGVENPLHMPRYRWGKLFANIFDKLLFSALKKVDLILACADSNSIDRLISRSNQKLEKKRIIQFPTRVDTSFFYPVNKQKCRDKLGIDKTLTVFISVARINKVKGWILILDSFKIFNKKFPLSYLIYVGDGEDREELEHKIQEYNLGDKILVCGFQAPDKVAEYLNAADIFVVGSYKEGWSVSMLEALACGKPIVSTNVSGAKDMILEGVNGFVIKERSPEIFSLALERSLMLENVEPRSRSIADKYALKNLSKDLSRIWDPLA